MYLWYNACIRLLQQKKKVENLYIKIMKSLKQSFKYFTYTEMP